MWLGLCGRFSALRHRENRHDSTDSNTRDKMGSLGYDKDSMAQSANTIPHTVAKQVCQQVNHGINSLLLTQHMSICGGDRDALVLIFDQCW